MYHHPFPPQQTTTIGKDRYWFVRLTDPDGRPYMLAMLSTKVKRVHFRATQHSTMTVLGKWRVKKVARELN